MTKKAMKHIGFHDLVEKNTAVYFSSFGIKCILQEVLTKIKNKSITHNTFRKQSADFIMCGFYCVAFIEFILEGKNFVRLC